MSENGYKIGKGKPPVDKQFTSENQPSPKLKSKGWERRRQAQKIMDMVLGLQDLTMQEMQDLIADIDEHPERHTVLEAKMANYITKEKFTTDYLDRHISKAPTEVKGEIRNITIEDMKKAFGGNIEDENKDD